VTSPERITDGWSQGPANVATPFDLFPTDLNWSDVLTTLVNGVPQGVQAAIADLENPDNYQITSLLDNPTLTPLVDAAYTSGLIDTLQPTSEQLTEGAARRQFPGFRRDLALATGRYRQRHQQHAFS
jgi:hypothetical protein